MRIDAHQHFWYYNPAEYEWIDESMTILRHDFLPEHLASELAASGFDGSIAVQARQSLEETKWLLDLAAKHSFILGVVGWVDLQAPNVRCSLVELVANPKLVGVRHIVQGEADDRFLLRPEFLRGVAALEEFGLTYDILIYPRHLGVAAEFVERFPQQRFVLDHLAKPFIKAGKTQPWASDLKRLAQFRNVWCKLSGLVTEADWKNWKPDHIKPYLETALDCFGAERLMVGSDWPVCTVAASYLSVMDVVIDYLQSYPEAVREAVLGGNAERFWNLQSRRRGLRAQAD